MKYQVKIAPVSAQNQSRVSTKLIRILGQDAEPQLKIKQRDCSIILINDP